MKKLIIVLLVLICINTWAQKMPEPKAAGKLISGTDSLQYAMGAFIGLWITTQELAITNKTLFQKGLDDILAKRPLLMSDAAIKEKVTVLQESVRKSKALQEEKDLFESLSKQPGVGMLPNGVRYIILQKGKNAQHPVETDSILIHLKASLPNGTVVDNTYPTGKPVAATITSFFPGLNDAFWMMSPGSKWKLYIPSALAYRDKGSGMIPPHSALVLEVELVQINPAQKMFRE